MTPRTSDTPKVAAGDSNRRCLAPRHRLVLIAGAIAACSIASGFVTRSDVDAPEALALRGPTPVRTSVAKDAIPLFAQSWVTPLNHTPSAHCSTVVALPSGDLMALWYGGSREGAADVAVYTSRMVAGTGTWDAPVEVIGRESAEDELDRRIKKVGNTVLFPDNIGNLWMVYSSVSIGGWSGSALNIKSSQDEGHTWGMSQRLTLNPFLNFSSLVRNKPIYARDGRVGLPVYHEMATKFPQMLWFRPGAGGTVEDYKMRSLSSASDLIQPTLVSIGDNEVLMVLRDGSDQRALHTAYSEDNGWTWTDAQPSNLPNPDAAVDAMALDDGRILLAYNDSTIDRENLSLAISEDHGRTWTARAVIEQEAGQEFSYPQLTRGPNGRIHLTYTWKRERIRHVTFNVAWLDQSHDQRLATAR